VKQTLAVFHVKHLRWEPLPHEQQPGPTYSRCVDRSTGSKRATQSPGAMGRRAD